MESNILYRKGADLLRAMAHPTRIEIMTMLLDRKECVYEFEQALLKSQPNISQHLNVLRKCGIVDYFQIGNRRCYYLVDRKSIYKILGCLRRII